MNTLSKSDPYFFQKTSMNYEQHVFFLIILHLYQECIETCNVFNCQFNSSNTEYHNYE